MRWLKPNLKSIYSLLGKPPPTEAPAQTFRMEAVRQTMLDVTKASGLEARHPELVRQIAYAVDIQALWYVRSDLMTAIASERGETFAQEKIAGISALFEGLLPQSFRYRPRSEGDRRQGARPGAPKGRRR
ncbi:MAG: hypothetical protein ABI343_09705 [Burkholderiaceae bacterium]